ERRQWRPVGHPITLPSGARPVRMDGPRALGYLVVHNFPLSVKTGGWTFGPWYAPTKPTLAVAPAAMVRFQSTLLTRTVEPVSLQLPFQPPLICCQLVGQVKLSVQLSTGLALVLVMSTLATYPLPQ